MRNAVSKRSLFSTVFFRVTALVVLMGALLTGTQTMLSYNSEKGLSLSLLRDQASGTSTIVARQIIAAVRFDNVEQVGKILRNVIDDPSNPSSEALVLNAEAGELYYYVSPSAGDHVHKPIMLETGKRAMQSGKMETGDEGLVIAVPLVNPSDQKLLGVMVTAWLETGAMATMKAGAIKNTAIAFVLLLVASAIFAFILRKQISLPLARVEGTMALVAGGDYSVAVPDTKRGDEIGSIANGLEEFRSTLAASEATTREGLFRGTAFNSASAALMLLDNDLNITATNPALSQMMAEYVADFRTVNPAFDPYGLQGQNFSIYHGPESRQRRMLDASKMPMNAEFQIGKGYYELSVDAIRDAEGTALGFVAEWRNVTAARRNAGIINAFESYQIVLDLYPDVTVAQANDRFAAFYGASASSLIGRSMKGQLLHNGTPVCELLGGGRPVSGTMILKRSGQSDVILEGSVNPILDAKGNMTRFTVLAADRTAESERTAAAESERAAMQAAQQEVVESLRSALGNLSQGDLTASINNSFSPEYEQLRADFNSATQNLLLAMRRVVENADAIRSEASEISSASDDLSRRTEQQAATLEETAAALNQLTVSVQSAAEVAVQANEMVAKAKVNAETSGAVVREAVVAMSEIEDSSGKISKITSVIDEIAFQTNLLALNAGVEAARAGEAGRGFAVVASEVRALAQRSSEAAREIAGLISSSTNQVKRGVGLVGQAGDALRGIESSVSEIYNFVSEIAVSAREQSTGLGEINTAVNQLDQVTQQNAAMFEETTAASHSLTREAQSLNDTMGHFRLGDSAPQAAATSNASSFRSSRDAEVAPSSTPAPAASRRLTVQAMKPTAQEEDWEDF